MNKELVSAAIIAGGQSKRFGSPKPQAQFLGKSLLNWSLELAQKLSSHILLIASDIPDEHGDKWSVFKDIIPDKGPLGGILTALKYMPTDWLFILPVDMPLLKPAIYYRLWEERVTNKPVVAVSNSGIESMVSLWHRSNSSVIEQSIRSNKLKINQILRELKATQVSFADQFPLSFFNINFEEDIVFLEAQVKNRLRKDV